MGMEMFRSVGVVVLEYLRCDFHYSPTRILVEDQFRIPIFLIACLSVR